MSCISMLHVLRYLASNTDTHISLSPGSCRACDALDTAEMLLVIFITTLFFGVLGLSIIMLQDQHLDWFIICIVGFQQVCVMCMCTCVCLYVCMYVCMYVCLNGWMDGWMDGCVCMYVCYGCICMYVCMYVCMCVCLYVCLLSLCDMYVCDAMYVCMYVYMCMNVCYVCRSSLWDAPHLHISRRMCAKCIISSRSSVSIMR